MAGTAVSTKQSEAAATDLIPIVITNSSRIAQSFARDHAISQQCFDRMTKNFRAFRAPQNGCLQNEGGL
jgi:hypothetical protein